MARGWHGQPTDDTRVRRHPMVTCPGRPGLARSGWGRPWWWPFVKADHGSSGCVFRVGCTGIRRSHVEDVRVSGVSTERLGGVSVPEIGEPVSFRMRKWDGSPHRQMMMVYLGSDAYGRWVSIPTGVRVRQPGSSSVGRAAHVMLMPHDGCFLAHFNAPTSENVIYADITTAPEFGHDRNGWVLAAADMDLDVVRRADGRTWIEDEDEFAEHIVSYGYPADVVATTRATADALLAAVRREVEPFGVTWRRWIGIPLGEWSDDQPASTP
jgi:uncharacterized protein